MTMNCDIILRWNATPEQLTALGAALWHWCNRAAGTTGIYRHLDNQALADMVAGKLPESSQAPVHADRRGVHFQFQDEASHGRQMTIGNLRRDIPAEGVEDIIIEGKSWNLSIK